MKSNIVKKIKLKKKKNASKQVVLVTYTLEKKVFPAASFKGLCVVPFQTK